MALTTTMSDLQAAQSCPGDSVGAPGGGAPNMMPGAHVGGGGAHGGAGAQTAMMASEEGGGGNGTGRRRSSGSGTGRRLGPADSGQPTIV